MKHVLGDQNFKELIDEIKQGKIEKIKVKRIALEMKGSVHGVFEEKEGQGELSDLMCLMLDRWYDEVLCDVDDGFLKFIKILEDLELKPLALKMKPVKPVDQFRPGGHDKPESHVNLNHKTKEKPEILGMLKIGLPTSHYIIPLLQEQKNVTASSAFASKESDLPICASHSVGKAVQEILHGIGWESEKHKIIDALIAAVQQDGKPKNPDEFNEKKIKVNIAKQDDAENQGEVEVEVKVQTDWGVIDDSNHTLNTIPVEKTEVLDKKNVKMVLRWDIGRTLSNKNIDGLHAIFAKNYAEETCNYYCINSWSQDYYPTPTIHKSRIYAIDYITIIQTS